MNLLNNFLVLGKDGSRVFSYRTVSELLSENKVILQLIKTTSSISTDSRIDLIDPLIFRFAKVVSIAPASKCLHDCDCGGLLRHSLLVALKAIEVSKYTNFKYEDLNVEELHILIIFLALLHDVGKVFSDITLSNEVSDFNYDESDLENTLDDYLSGNSNLPVKIYFDKCRSKSHENNIVKAIPFLLYKQSAIGRFLTQRACKKAINSIVKSDDKDGIYKLIKVADIYACKTSINKFSPMYEIGCYLTLLFRSRFLDISEPGFYKINGGYVVEQGSKAYQSTLKAFDYYFAILDECNTFSDLSHSSFEKLYRSCKESVLYNDDSLSYGQSFDINLNYPRKSFFVELSDSNFIVQGAYKRSCIWRSLYDRGSIRFVYGFIICLDYLDHDDSVFKIMNEYDDKEVKNLIQQYQSVVDNFDIDLITSFDMSLDDNQEYQIDPATVSIDSFSKKRSEFLSSCSRTRSKNKAKIKSKLSRDISRLQKEILENEKSMLSDDYDYF